MLTINAFRVWRSLWVCLITFLLLPTAIAATSDSASLTDLFYPDKTSLVEQQITLLNKRIERERSELKYLQQQAVLPPPTTVTENMLNQSELDIAAGQSSLDSINIELAESKQTISQLEKELQELENQLNLVNMFGLKVTQSTYTDLERLYEDRQDHKNLLNLEKTRARALLKLQGYATTALQLYQASADRLHTLYQSNALLHLKDQQAHAELDFQTKQNTWLTRLDSLENELTKLRQAGKGNEHQYDQLRADIFYTKSQVDFMYLQMLLTRYQDQIQQLDITISTNKSISYLNDLSTRMQSLSKQVDALGDLLASRQNILTKNKYYFVQTPKIEQNQAAQFNNLEASYNTAIQKINALKSKLAEYKRALDKAIQTEISSRQGLPGFDLNAWLHLGGEILLLPHLTFQVFKSLSGAILTKITKIHFWYFVMMAAFEILWVFFAMSVYAFLKQRVSLMPDHAAGHINLRWLTVKLFQRLLLDLAIFGNILWLFMLLGVPLQNYLVLINLSFVWLFFRGIILVSRICLIETVHDQAGYDVRLYHHLKWIFILGGLITALAVFIRQLSAIAYGVKDLADRLFMLFLFVASLLLLRQWKRLPDLLLTYIDPKRIYLTRLIRLLGLLIPLVLLVNSLVGLSGYVNLVLTVSWYECIFIVVLAVYLLLRGSLNDAMEFGSKLLIRHVTNGWLWTEAFLKPIDRILHITLFLLAWAVLFLLYGWDQQSTVVERLNTLLHYPLAHMLNTVIMPISMIEIAIIIYLLGWGARWTREFVYRFLLSRTKDLGLRNSIAILSQYAFIVSGILISLSLLGIDFKALTVVASALALGIGLGLRDLVNNFACGFLLLIERPLRIGDIITIGEFEGEVIHIGGRAITLRTWDHIDVVVPNTEIFTKSFSNWTSKDAVVRTVIPIQMDRHDRPQDIQALVLEVLHRHKDVLTDPMPEVLAKEMSDGLTGFEVRYFLNLRQVKSRPRLRSEILIEIWEAFDQHGVRIPYPHRAISLEKSTQQILPLEAKS